MNNTKSIVVIISSIFLLLILFNLVNCSSSKKNQLSHSEPTFVGSKTCIECHQKEYDDWMGSDHQLAMDTASSKSIVGDFNNITHTFKGFTSKFYKKGDKFYVYTQGPEGKAEEYEIVYAFGIRPLQQYVIAF